MPAQCIAEVMFSRCADLDTGDLVIGLMGWQKFMILDRNKATKIPKEYPNP